MDRIPAVVSAELRVRLLAADGAALPLDAQLAFRADDPYAVEALFDTGGDEPVRWVFSRDLIAEGLLRTAGIGDVLVQPGLDDAGHRHVRLRLSSPDGTAVLEVAARDLEGFLTATYRLVPAGTEGAHLDLDGVVERLLGRV